MEHWLNLSKDLNGRSILSKLRVLLNHFVVALINVCTVKLAQLH